MKTLFISDLHLSADHEHTIDLFCRFLAGDVKSADALYILGDLFEYWIGDDYVETPLQKVIAALKQTSAHTPVFIMHGNRDFLLGREFELASGCQIIEDPTLIDLYGQATLLLHGDSMCIDDVEYMKMRADFRNPQTQKFLLSKSVEERLQIARQLRQSSQEATRYKPEDITDVNPQCVMETLQKWQASRMIHGHTHRPAIHSLPINGQDAKRIVLGDWYEQGSMLLCSENGCELQSIN